MSHVMLCPADTKISFQIRGSSQPNRGTDMLTKYYDAYMHAKMGVYFRHNWKHIERNNLVKTSQEK